MPEEVKIKEFTEIAERCKSNSHRLDKLEENVEKLAVENKALYSLASSVEKISINMDYLKSSLDENSKDLKDMRTEIENVKSAPLKNKANVYDKVVWAILGALGMGILYFLLAEMFPVMFK